MDFTNMINEALNSYLEPLSDSFSDRDGCFLAKEYIRSLMEKCRKEGQIVLDFYHDISGEDGELLDTVAEYRIISINTEKSAEELTDYFNNELSRIMHDLKSADSPSETVNIRAARINKLLEIGTPAIIVNNEKRLLINSLIADDTELIRVIARDIQTEEKGGINA